MSLAGINCISNNNCVIVGLIAPQAPPAAQPDNSNHPNRTDWLVSSLNNILMRVVNIALYILYSAASAVQYSAEWYNNVLVLFTTHMWDGWQWDCAVRLRQDRGATASPAGGLELEWADSSVSAGSCHWADVSHGHVTCLNVTSRATWYPDERFSPSPGTSSATSRKRRRMYGILKTSSIRYKSIFIYRECPHIIYLVEQW